MRYHHILDVGTGQPARLCRSVTLVSASPVLPDAVAKGVFILGPEKGMALVERIRDLEGGDRDREERGARVLRSERSFRASREAYGRAIGTQN